MSALKTQVGGDHYKGTPIQPIQYIEANKLHFLEGCVVKRVTRHFKPTGKGREDIEKAIHELQLLLELRYPQVKIAMPRGADGIDDSMLIGAVRYGPILKAGEVSVDGVKQPKFVITEPHAGSVPPPKQSPHVTEPLDESRRMSPSGPPFSIAEPGKTVAGWPQGQLTLKQIDQIQLENARLRNAVNAMPMTRRKADGNTGVMAGDTEHVNPGLETNGLIYRQGSSGGTFEVADSIVGPDAEVMGKPWDRPKNEETKMA